MSIDLSAVAYAKTIDEFSVALEDVIDAAHQQGLVVYTTWTLSFTRRQSIIQHVCLTEDHRVNALPDATKIINFVQTRGILVPSATSDSVYIATW